MATSISSLQSLQSLFPGAFSIDSKALAKALGIAEKTIRNQGEAFPIPPVRVGRRRLFRLLDVAAYIDGQLGIGHVDSPSVAVQASLSQGTAAPRRRGRPRKEQQRI